VTKKKKKKKKKEKKKWKTKRENHNRYIEYLPKFMKRKSTKNKRLMMMMKVKVRGGKEKIKKERRAGKEKRKKKATAFFQFFKATVEFLHLKKKVINYFLLSLSSYFHHIFVFVLIVGIFPKCCCFRFVLLFFP